jgi:DNA polymerase III epsilon subunit-like protein
MKLFFDTETTGLPPRGIDPYFFLEWSNCRIVQIAWIVIDVEGNIVKKADYIIKPAFFIIPDESTAIHGISQEMALTQGKDIKDVLREFIKDMSPCDTIIAHNIDFDYNVVLSELARAEIDPCNMKHVYRYCTMRKGSMPNEKWYKLGDLYKKYFGNAPTLTLHRALNDVIMCKDIYMYQQQSL